MCLEDDTILDMIVWKVVFDRALGSPISVEQLGRAAPYSYLPRTSSVSDMPRSSGFEAPINESIDLLNTFWGESGVFRVSGGDESSSAP